MSMYTMPPETMPDVTTMNARLERLGYDMAAMIPPPFGGDPEAMKRHIATSAALASYGAGLAGHAFGVWLSAVTSSIEVAQKMTELTVGRHSKSGAKDEGPAQAPTDMDTGSMARAVVQAAVAETAARTTAAVADTADVAEAVAETILPVAPAAIDRPDAPDDLKAIGGVGPKLEKVLNGYGIWTYNQIAGLGEAEILWLDEKLGFPGRVERDDWRGQAAALAGAGA